MNCNDRLRNELVENTTESVAKLEEKVEEKAKADKMFRDLNEAKTVLTDNDKRDKYDQGFDLEDINSGKADSPFGPGGMGGMNPDDIFSMFMGAQGGMGGMGGHPGMGRGRTSGGHPGSTFRFG